MRRDYKVERDKMECLGTVKNGNAQQRTERMKKVLHGRVSMCKRGQVE